MFTESKYDLGRGRKRKENVGDLGGEDVTAFVLKKLFVIRIRVEDTGRRDFAPLPG